MEITKITLAATCIGFGSLAYASELTVTNIFEANTPASAAEVNQNFDDVKQAVDDNDLRIITNEARVSSNEADISNNSNSINSIRQSVSVYDGSTRVGALLTYFVNTHALFILSDTGYVEEYVPEAFNTVIFTTSDCTGQGYYFPNFSLPSSNGFVVSTSNTGGYGKIYIAPNSTMASVSRLSQLSNDNCVVASGTIQMYEAYPNDPAITGFPNNYTGTLRVGF